MGVLLVKNRLLFTVSFWHPHCVFGLLLSDVSKPVLDDLS